MPLGDWNIQSETVRGSTVLVELNAAVNLDVDTTPIHEFANNKPHPGKAHSSG